MTNLIRQLASFFRVPERVALIFTDRGDGTSGPVSPDNPVPVTVTSSEVVRAEPTYALIEDQVVDGPLPDVPAWANRALLRVTRGTLWLGYGDSQDSPGIPMGGSVELTGVELQVTRCRTSDGGIVRVDYWQVG
ncbi:hypothetical protein [Deinococcus soli (ex Cha et al. 2016)]|uniref:Uncharacterized protein n=1 Tax=Deinococcus soli (ex Cha et al. 2016) TaxID=1309411 RepID=A0ACC6KMT4_9DEIO|nr:hypothetical protein [Deinococcus soli (ex Cha et al. 2016)]MDR6753810.1 hypothetical protein [Deinococcus soli (ex Cha et al. 2016)]